MTFYLSTLGNRLGPFSVEQVNAILKQGRATTSDLVWTEGWPLWRPIYEVPDFATFASNSLKVGEASTKSTDTNSQSLNSVSKVLAGGEADILSEWHGRAAEQGYAPAQYHLGWIYETGRGVEPNRRKALEWYEKAARQGEAQSIEALKRLGHDYQTIRGYLPNQPRSEIHLKVSCANGQQKPQPSTNEPEGTSTPLESHNGLWADIKSHAGEVYQKGDASAGFKLLQELFGVASVLLLLANVEILITGGRSSFAINSLMSKLLTAYTRLDSQQRRQVRAWVSIARTGFGLFGK